MTYCKDGYTKLAFLNNMFNLRGQPKKFSLPSQHLKCATGGIY